MYLIAIWACKLSRGLLRVFGSGGTSLPGKLALWLCPGLLRRLSAGVRVIAVSGTNGKTTTCRLIEQGLGNAGISFFANRSGANLLPGVTAEFVAHSTWRGVPKYSAAVIECDEAALKKILQYVSPEVIVITNVFRDQLDRYGEVTTTLQNLRTAVAEAPKAALCLNADDSLVVSLAEQTENPCHFYGVDVPLYPDTVGDISDAMYCIRCKGPYEYRYRTYGHLGGFFCPHCGYERPQPSVSISRVEEITSSYSVVELSLHGEKALLRLELPGAYNICNAAAAAAALDAFGVPGGVIRASLQKGMGFGRMETFPLGGGVRMILVKNPAGYSQVLNYLREMETDFELLCCLNDRYADGTDISWIWDVPFERLCEQEGKIRQIYVSGTRAEEMWLRLKYAGINTEKLQYVRNYKSFVQSLAKKVSPLVIVPTYTAMMELRPLLVKKTGGKAFWE